VTGIREPLLNVTVNYGYFVIQARAAHGPAGMVLTGVLENLGTGEKRFFEGSEALARLIHEWGQGNVGLAN
jgi:hypothetical protein